MIDPKKVLICVLCGRWNSPDRPWMDLLGTARETWDSIDVNGTETIFYLAKPGQPLIDKVIAFDIDDNFFTLGKRDLMMFEYALQHCPDWKYLARPNVSCYTSKQRLLDFCQDLPDEGVVVGSQVEDDPPWIFGGLGFIFSRDVVQAMVNNQHQWDHSKMEDVAMSQLCFRLGYKTHPVMKSAAINAYNGRWRLMSYANEDSFEFDDVSEVKDKSTAHFIRVNIPEDRTKDSFLMRELYNKYENAK